MEVGAKKYVICKKFRLISYVNPIPSLLQGQFVIEEVLNEEHYHEVEGIPLRGLSREQKGIVLFCEEKRIGDPKRVLAGFRRRGNVNIAANVAVIPTPTTEIWGLERLPFMTLRLKSKEIQSF